MSVKRCTIAGRSVHSLDELYDEIARQLPLPDYFGRNLDALWDVLSTDIEGPVEMVWGDAEHSKRSMGKDYERVVFLLRDLTAEREDFRIVFGELRRGGIPFTLHNPDTLKRQSGKGDGSYS